MKTKTRIGLVIWLASSVFCPLSYSQDPLVHGIALEKEHRFHEARQIYEQLLEADAKQSDVHFQLGVLDLRHFDNIESGLAHLKQALELDPENAAYHFMLAEAYAAELIQAGFFRKFSVLKKANHHLHEAAQIEPRNVVYLEGLVQFYAYVPGLLGGRKSTAHQLADSIGGIDPVAGLLAHAWVYSQEGKQELVHQFYQDAIELNPTDGRGYYRYGYFYLDQEEYEHAITQFNQYVRVAPDTAESHYSLGEAFYRAGRFKEAVEALSIARSSDAYHVATIYRLAQCYEQLGSTSEALALYQRYAALVPAGRRAEVAAAKISALSTTQPGQNR